MNTMLRFVPLLMLISCANVQSTTMESDGSQVHKLTCSEFNSSLQECKSKASELCRNDYKLLSHHEETFPDSGDGFYVHTQHHLAVACKD